MNLPCCWKQEQIEAEECPFLRPEDGELRYDRKRRFLDRCLECPRFWEELEAQPEESRGLAGVFPFVVEELIRLRAQVKSQTPLLEARTREVKFLHEVALVLQTSSDMDEVIAMALTAVTAGQGFGFNRAILLLADTERGELKGYFAVGPREREEAARIWREIEERDYTLRELGRFFFEERMAQEREKFRDLLARLTTPLSRGDHLFVRTLGEQTSRHVRSLSGEPGLDPGQVAALGVEELVLVPLASEDRQVGLLLADNIVSGQPIVAEDLQSLETFALPVAFAIDRAALYGQLQQELERSRESHRRLREQQETILRMEKMAAVGKVTSDIAHSIRNPLTVIGGFARNLLKADGELGPQRRYLESIIREARRLEEALGDVMAHSEARHPAFDWWDINQLLTGIYSGLQENLQTAGLACRLDFDPTLPLVRVDYHQLTYCLRSLLRHALDALSEGGRLTLGTRRDGETLEVILDFAVGPAGASALRAGLGSLQQEPGQGKEPALRLCRRILEEHGAEVVREEDAAGVRYRFRLPREGARSRRES